jgi:chromosome segregation ATPase
MAESVKIVADERDRLTDLHNLTATNEELLANQSLQFDALQNELAAARERGAALERTQQQLQSADARIHSIELAMNNYVGDIQVLRGKLDATENALADARRSHASELQSLRAAHESERQQLQQQCDELRGTVRIAHAAAADAHQRADTSHVSVGDCKCDIHTQHITGAKRCIEK